MSKGIEAESSSSAWDQLCRRFSIDEIRSATQNFDEGLVIGKGGFGKVYKATLENGGVAAIKRLDYSRSSQGETQFVAEIETLSKLRHCHLVSLLGYCNDGQEMILVYEFMPNGTLEEHRSRLSWSQRLKICLGAARGLDYLHTGTGTKHGVIHRDVKSSNILLDHNWDAKISDFGLSKIGPTNQTNSFVKTGVRGTFGYIDPCYFSSTRLMRKSDVYSFGVVLFELLCGRAAVDNTLDEEQWGLAGWVQKCIKDGKLVQIVDSRISYQISSRCLKEFAGIAGRCLDNDQDKRPTMAEIVVNLVSIMSMQQRPISLPTMWTLKEKMLSLFPARTPAIAEPKNGQLIFSDIQRITNNFQLFIGEGGFGKVYLGYMDRTQVAVKMLSPSAIQAYKEFQAEAKILMNVNHKNLTRLVGYCHEGKHLGLIYEFMVNGNLRKHLSEKNARVLHWRARLQTTIDAAQGLEYLHHGCKPPIIHGDVKSTNILLNEKFEAKLADFRLSSVFPVEDGTYVSTMIAGTPGYVDPQYFFSNKITKESDVYSFGVVLMEVITGQTAIIRNGQENMHIVQWLSSKVQTADVENIADPRLKGNFNVDSVRRAVKIALDCTDPIPGKRPTMTDTVTELKVCLELEIATSHETDSNDAIVLFLPGPESAFLPHGR